ncbi:MAG: hypothetical protein R3338_04865, partial [Thermoanaerobaculia bacterium]|nr:hypothetical protein [Thermoanaerobaculia bacterium]
MRKSIVAIAVLVFLTACATTPPEQTPEPVVAPPAEKQMRTTAEVVKLDSPSPLVVLKLMVRNGYTADPRGKAGLANLVAEGLIEGGFGDSADPVTKEELAEITQPWGDGAMPGAQVAGRTTTFHITVPREVLDEYLQSVLVPMFNQPLFMEPELDRLKNEMKAAITSARFENLENLGLDAIDEYVNEGTPYEHQAFGAEETIPALTRDDVVRFYRSFYRPGNMIVGVSTSDQAVVDRIMTAVNTINAELTTEMPEIELGEP